MRILILLFTLVGFCYGATEGPNFGGTLANDASVGVAAWTNPENAGASDDSDATVSANPSEITNYLKATNFGFSKVNGIINGIEVFVERAVGLSCPGAMDDYRVRIVKGGTIGSTEKAVSGNWESTDTTVTYGSSSDKWGETWVASDVTDSGFGVVFSGEESIGGSCNANVDAISITVHYTPAIIIDDGGSGTITLDVGGSGTVTIE